MIHFSAMIYNLEGTDRVNNLLASLNIKPVNAKNLKVMERGAGHFVEQVSKMSTEKAAENLSSRRWSKMIIFFSRTLQKN